jgi:hypothetical protein
MHNFETLHMMPQMLRNEGDIEGDSGYEYPEKYRNKLYLMQDKIVLFEKRKFYEFPVILITALIEIIVKEFINIEQLTIFKNSLIEDQEHRLSEIVEKLKYELSDNGSNKINEIRNALVYLEKNSLDKISIIEGQINSISSNISEYTIKTVNAELETVYANFENAIVNIVKEEVNNIRNELTASENKLKPAQIMLYKEMGMNLDEIIKLKHENLL